MPPEERMPQGALRYIAAVVALGALFVAGGLVHAWRAPPAGWAWLFVPLVAAAIFVTQRRAFVFYYRGQRTTNVFDEPVVALAFLILPLGAALLSLVAGLAAAQVVARRKPVKAAYNLAAYTTSAALAGLAFFGLQLAGMPVYFAAVAPAFVYPFVTSALLAGLFARLDEGSALKIFRDRLYHQHLLNTTLGTGLILCGYALWSLHPLALVGLAPFGLLASSFIELHARAEREGRIRQRLEEVTLSLISPARIDDVAEKLLECCGELFLAGEATLVLDGGGSPGRTWTRTFEGGPVRRRAIEAPLVGHDGRHLGVLIIAPAQRAPNANALELDRPLMNVLARQVASALEVADAFQRLVSLKSEELTSRKEAERAMRTNVVARSLVRRIVLDLVGSIGASEATIAQLGRRLALEVQAVTADDFAAAFSAMGLGELALAGIDEDTYVFEADDLLERRAGSTQPTCHLARGYLEGAVSVIHGRAALGAEVRCQSRGHERCRFVVKPKVETVPAPRRAARLDSSRKAS